MRTSQIAVALILFCVSGFAKDKKDEAKPAPDITLTLRIAKKQRDYANLARQAMPIEMDLQRREQEIRADLDKAQEACGEKLKFNPTSLECESAPPPTETPKANEDKK
jgi:hypothetical protein